MACEPGAQRTSFRLPGPEARGAGCRNRQLPKGDRAQQPSAQLFEPPERSNAGLQAALGRNGARIQRQRCRRQGGPGPTRARLRAGRFRFAVPKPWRAPSFPDIGRTGHGFAGRQRRYQIPAGNGGGRSDRTDRASKETRSRFTTNSLQVTAAGRSRQWFGAVPAARVVGRASMPPVGAGSVRAPQRNGYPRT